MANRNITGYKEKQIYRNERFTKGTVSSNDPLFEGSLRRLINFKVSNQSASIENREPFLTVPLFDLNDNEIRLSKDSFIFAVNSETEHAYILDPKQTKKIYDDYEGFIVKEFIKEEEEENLRIIDGDTFELDNQKYRLAFIDTPELDDKDFSPIDQTKNYKTLGEESKAFTEKFLDGDFLIVNFDFQPEVEDQFGRKIVFVAKKKQDTEEYELLNIELLREGLAMLYNLNRFDSKLLYFSVVNDVKIKTQRFNLYSELNTAVEEGSVVTGSCFSEKYTDKRVVFSSDSSRTVFSKPLVYKIKKETDLKKILDGKNEGSIIKRVIKTFEVNQTDVKKDLEIFNDQSIKYDFLNKDFSIINGKYSDQHINKIGYITSTLGMELYRGIIEIIYTAKNLEEGTVESFSLLTYDRPETKIELQSMTSMKPNILDKRSFIPEKITGIKANIQGYSNPSVNAVLLEIDLKDALNYEIPEKENKPKYLKPASAMLKDFSKYKMLPLFKAPNLTSARNKYMYRWDLVNMKEIDFNNEEEVKKAKPVFRSAWTEIDFDTGVTKNIEKDEGRVKALSLKKKSLDNCDEYYIITSVNTRELLENEKFDLETITDKDDGGKTLNSFDHIIDSIREQSLDDIKNSLTTIHQDEASDGVSQVFTIGNTKFNIFKYNDKKTLTEKIIHKKEEDNFSLEESILDKSKAMSYLEIQEIFNQKDKKVAFLFMPISVIMENEKDKKVKAYLSITTRGVVFDLATEIKEKLPIELDFGELMKKEIEGIDFLDFFEEGIQATFYLHTYKDLESLTEESTFYDNIAYSRSSSTYSYKEKNTYSYFADDFIDDKLDQESDMLKNCEQVGQFQDRLLIYGNPKYNNSLFMSEEGSPYYFSFYGSFQFDHEVVHVQAFKNILLVFTINDIWVIYEWQDVDKETGIVTLSYRYKKVLYNISTTKENKPTIKNITRYMTLMSNNVLYLIKPSTYISDETEFFLTILSQNIEAIVRDPLEFINQRLKYHNIFEQATEYKMTLNATDNFIKLYYSVKVEDVKRYTLVLTYDILNARWTEEDTCSFGFPEQIYLLDSTTKYEMLTEMNNNLFITYQTDKYKMLMMDEFGQSYYDKNIFEDFPIQYFIDSGYLKLNEHLKKRFKTLHFTIKNIDTRKIFFTYNFTIDDNQFENNFEPVYSLNNSNEIIQIEQLKNLEVDVKSLKQMELEIMNSVIKTKDFKLINSVKNKLVMNKELSLKIKDSLISGLGGMNDFLLDFSNLQIGDIMTVKQNLLGIGRLPRVELGWTAKNRFYILSFGLIYSEHGGK